MAGVAQKRTELERLIGRMEAEGKATEAGEFRQALAKVGTFPEAARERLLDAQIRTARILLAKKGT